MLRWIYLLLITPLFIYSFNLEQINKEEIFLTSEELVTYQKLSQHTPNIYSITLKHLTKSDFDYSLRISEKNCEQDLDERSCDIFTHQSIPKSFIDIFNLDELTLSIISNNENILKDISRDLLDSKVFQAGGPYINVLLDKYSKSIS